MEHNDWASQLFSPSGPLDEIWHTHLSFVDRYQHDILVLSRGAHRVIEHSPVLGLEPRRRYAAAHEKHTARMERMGESVDNEFWPAPKPSMFTIPRNYDSDEHCECHDESGEESEGPVCG